MDGVTEPPVPPRVPPSWPAQVLPPGTEGWQESAVRWLWDLVPAPYREHQLLHQQPALLARLARQTVEAQLHAMRGGYRTVRTDLKDVVEPQVIEGAVDLYAIEGTRLRELAKQTSLVEDALAHGVRWRGNTPRSPSDPSRRRGGMG